eukprot:gene27585-36387_t
MGLFNGSKSSKRILLSETISRSFYFGNHNSLMEDSGSTVCLSLNATRKSSKVIDVSGVVAE